VWRSDPGFLLLGFSKPEIQQWVPAATRIWDAPIDVSVKISASTNLLLISEATFQMLPSDVGFDAIVTWIENAASVASFLLLAMSHRRSL